jgi:F420-dependent oxidoreductase-like protein
MPPKFGVITPQGWRLDLVKIKDPVDKYEQMTRFAQEAERLAYDSVWVYDHFHTVPTQQLETTFECWTSTAGLARDTSTIRIGQMVTCNNYRNPALLAKMASTVDVMSHGRLDFGIGAGWYEAEYNAYGYDYPDGPTRLKMLREALQIIHAMWKDDYATFEGTYYHVDGAINEPKGVQKPHIPLWVGGSGERVTLKLVAQYADACNLSETTPEQYKHKLEVLKQHCDNLGRDYNSIIKSSHNFISLVPPGEDPDKVTEPFRHGASFEDFSKRTIVGTPQQMVDYFGSLRDTGIEYFVIYFRNDLTRLDTLQLFASDVMNILRK